MASAVGEAQVIVVTNAIEIELAKFKIEPGDKVIVRVNKMITNESSNNLRETLVKRLGIQAGDLLIFPPELELPLVLSAQELATEAPG